MRAFVATACWIVALALAPTGGACAQAPAGDEVVAKLGGTELRLSDVQRLLAAQSPEAREQTLKSPELLDRLVRTETFRRALLAEARAKGWDKRPEVADQMERAADQALVQSYVNELSRPGADYPSEDELRDAYRANEAEFRAPRQYRVAQIYIAAGDAARSEAARRKAEDVSRRARAKDADFAALARSESEHKPSAAAGGDMGWVAENDLTPEVRSALTALDKGEVSFPVRTAQGWHVIKLLDFKPSALRPYAEVKDSLAAALRLKRAKDNERRYLSDLASKESLVVNEIALGRLQPPKETKESLK